MLIVSLIIISIIAGALCFALPNKGKAAATVALLASSAAVIISVVLVQAVNKGNVAALQFNAPWLMDFNARFSFKANSLSVLMCLLTAICFVIISLSTLEKPIAKQNTFYGLLLLSMAGLFGVFTAHDALLFYVFWEVALIPVYFLASMYGTQQRVASAFKFFIYTFVGSVLMLIALIFLYTKNPEVSFSWASITQVFNTLSNSQQSVVFWMLFIAFAIKMPIFPLHTWQPGAYQNTYTPVTMVLSALMVKMGLFAVVKWLIPIVPLAAQQWLNVVIILCIIGIIYASILAIIQQDAKKVIAYSSIAHIGLMCAALFSYSELGYKGAILQMFTHGINIIGMWVLLYFIEHKTNTTKLSELGGLASTNSLFTIFLVLITLANVALPLTNGFPGEFMMFSGIFTGMGKYRITYTAIAGIGVILSAVYSLNLVQKIAFGPLRNTALNKQSMQLSAGEFCALSIVSILILVFGFYPQPLLNFISSMIY
jgi:NADH-quinone oxidoreductase subunit M